MPGGVGLAQQAFMQGRELLESTLSAIESCPCEYGWPCLRAFAQNAAPATGRLTSKRPLFVLKSMRSSPNILQHLDISIESIQEPVEDLLFHGSANPSPLPRYGVLDIETRRSAEEVGGWHHVDKMGISVAVLYDVRDDTFHTYAQERTAQLMERLSGLELVIGFNIRRFDYRVLSAFAPLSKLTSLPTLDLLESIKERLGYRLSLDHLAQCTLNAEKSADGLQALAWWKEGRIDKITEYCTKDVSITRDLYLHGKRQGFVLFTNKAKQKVRLPVEW